MITSPEIGWRGYYFDGRSSSRHGVTVLLRSHGLEIEREDATNLYWGYDEIRQTQGAYAGEQIRFEKGEEIAEALVVLDVAFLKALQEIAPWFRTPFHNPELRRWKITLLAAVGIVVLGLALYFFGIPALAEQLAAHIPVSWEERLGEGVVALKRVEANGAVLRESMR